MECAGSDDSAIYGSVKFGAVVQAGYAADFVICPRRAGTHIEVVRVTSAGNTGFGTTAPQGIIHSNKAADGTDVVSAVFQNYAGNANTSVSLIFANTAGTYYDSNGSGKIQVKRQADSSADLNLTISPGGDGATTSRLYVDGSTGNFGFSVTAPTAVLHPKAGTTAANSAPLKLNSGTVMATAEVGAFEFTTDDLYFTITTGAVRQKVVLTAGLTTGRIPFGTTNGRLTDSGNLVYASGGSVITVGNDKISSTAPVFTFESTVNSSYIALNTKNAAGTVKVFTFDLNGIFICQNSFRAYKDGSDSLGTGANIFLANGATNRAWVVSQLSAANHLDSWYYDGATWTAIHRYENTGRVGFGTGQTPPTATLFLKAGSTAANSAPIKLNSGAVMTTAEVGAFEFTTDDLYFTITTGAARQKVVLTAGLTSGRIPYATTNGRLTDSAAMTFDGTLLGAQINGSKLIDSVIPPSGKRFLSYPVISALSSLVSISVSPGATVSYGSTAYPWSVSSGTGANGAARLNINPLSPMMSGVSSFQASVASISGASVGFLGICTANLTATQLTQAIVTKHAAFIFYNDIWYASVADDTTQTTAVIAVSATTHVFKIDGSNSGHMVFYIDGTQVADLTTNIATDAGYMQWFVNNCATGADEIITFYSWAYYGV
jgi:hypothetical protein